MRFQEQWTEHATFMDQLAADGFVVLGGPLGDERKVLLVVDAADESEIRSTLRGIPGFNQAFGRRKQSSDGLFCSRQEFRRKGWASPANPS